MNVLVNSQRDNRSDASSVMSFLFTEVHNVTRFRAEWASKATVLVHPIQCMDFCFVKCILVITKQQFSVGTSRYALNPEAPENARTQDLAISSTRKTEHLLRPRHRHVG